MRIRQPSSAASHCLLVNFRHSFSLVNCIAVIVAVMTEAAPRNPFAGAMRPHISSKKQRRPVS
jgi:hypothetical protein